VTAPDPPLVPAPELAEVSRTWWDVEHDPAVTWDASGRRFDLVDPRQLDRRLRLVELAEPPPDPATFAARLATAFAACDFPPTGDGVPPARAAATLRAQGLDRSTGRR
jgi:hypothetical protein